MTSKELENILLESEITQNIDKWVNKAIEVKYKDKELLALQTIIKKLQKELDNSISKDIIRDKIKELEEIEKQFEFIDNDSYARKRNKDFIIMLKGLLGE